MAAPPSGSAQSLVPNGRSPKSNFTIESPLYQGQYEILDPPVHHSKLVEPQRLVMTFQNYACAEKLIFRVRYMTVAMTTKSPMEPMSRA